VIRTRLACGEPAPTNPKHRPIIVAQDFRVQGIVCIVLTKGGGAAVGNRGVNSGISPAVWAKPWEQEIEYNVPGNSKFKGSYWQEPGADPFSFFSTDAALPLQFVGVVVKVTPPVPRGCESSINSAGLISPNSGRLESAGRMESRTPFCQRFAFGLRPRVSSGWRAPAGAPVLPLLSSVLVHGFTSLRSLAARKAHRFGRWSAARSL
jgi:hypothetical protein